MNRPEVGLLVSRGLAVWIVMNSIHGIVSAITPDRQVYIDPPGKTFFIVASLIAVTVKVGVACLLWFKADKFGNWVGSQPTDTQPALPLDRQTLAISLIQVGSAYWIISSLVELTDSKFLQDRPKYVEAVDPSSPHAISLVVLVALFTVAMFNARAIARKF